MFGARFDVFGIGTPGLTGLLCTKKVLQLRRIVDKAGCILQNAQAVASFLRVKSTKECGKVSLKVVWGCKSW